MMTRLSVSLIALALLSSGLAHAAEDAYAVGMTEKAVRGLVNVASGWVEVPMQVKKGYDDGVAAIDNPAGSRSSGAVLGVFRGVSHAAGRTAWGAVNLATFWAANPTHNQDLLFLLDANYAWEEGVKKPLACPRATDGIERVAMRIHRGLNNTVGSFLEIPGQVTKHSRLGNWWAGVPKGVYYTVCRIGSGVPDLVLFPLPGPVDNLMVPFEEVHPWDALEKDFYSNIQ